MSTSWLPWYDLPETRSWTEAFWECAAEHVRHAGFERVAERLHRGGHADAVLGDAELLLGQACGLVAAGPGRDRLRIVATPCYSAPGCEGSDYRSLVIVASRSRVESLAELRGKRCVIDDQRSHSGAGVLRSLVAPLHEHGRFFSAVHASGGPAETLRWIADGHADVGAVDCVTHALMGRYRPELALGTRVLQETPAAPAPPFVTGAQTTDGELERLREALRAVVRDATIERARSALLLAGLDVRAPGDYDPLVRAQVEADRQGYREMPWADGAAAGRPA